ncbi:glycosyltransferase family 9 protein [Parvularcula oceani]|uniref:glycosyltransferase family 9 protein n=1 Tax=Parvularcula oceani TaxID=1247963 RepID=UPI0004E22141|nr:glycosyltransferase family 9 protein [Parvularcula oceani]
MTRAPVLILKRDRLRHFVEAEPAFVAIRQAHPGARIDLLTSEAIAPLARASGLFGRVTTGAGMSGLPAGGGGYAAVYDLDAGSPGLAGPAMRKLLHDAGIAVPQRLPDLSFAAEALHRACGTAPACRAAQRPFLLMILPEAEEERWPAASYGELAVRLAGRGMAVIITGPAKLGGFAERCVWSASRKLRDPRAVLADLTGWTDSARLAALAYRAEGFLSGPCDGMHLAAAMGTGGIALLPRDDCGDADALFGRNVVRLTAADPGTVPVGTVLSLLESMRIVPSERLRTAAG